MQSYIDKVLDVGHLMSILFSEISDRNSFEGREVRGQEGLKDLLAVLYRHGLS